MVLPEALVLRVRVLALVQVMPLLTVMLVFALRMRLAVPSAVATVDGSIVELLSFSPETTAPTPPVTTVKVDGSRSKFPVVPPGAVKSAVPVSCTLFPETSAFPPTPPAPPRARIWPA